MKFKILKKQACLIIASAISLMMCSATLAMIKEQDSNAKTFDIKTEIYIDGSLVSSPMVIAHPNQKAVVTIADKQSSLKMQLIALGSESDSRNEEIKIKYDIHYVAGKEKIHTSPQMIVLPNQIGNVKLTSKDGHSFEMSVLAKRSR